MNSKKNEQIYRKGCRGLAKKRGEAKIEEEKVFLRTSSYKRLGYKI